MWLQMFFVRNCWVFLKRNLFHIAVAQSNVLKCHEDHNVLLTIYKTCVIRQARVERATKCDKFWWQKTTFDFVKKLMLKAVDTGKEKVWSPHLALDYVKVLLTNQHKFVSSNYMLMIVEKTAPQNDLDIRSNYIKTGTDTNCWLVFRQMLTMSGYAVIKTNALNFLCMLDLLIVARWKQKYIW